MSRSPAPAVTVVITCYNHAPYIGQAIQSVLNQSFPDFEIIISDDGSTDGSPEVIRAFDDPRIHCIFERNAGPTVATLRAVSRARAPLLVLLAGDDYCAPHRLEQQVAEILNQGFGATLCIPQLVDENSRPLPDSRWPVFFKAFPTSSRELLSRLFFDGNFLCGTSVMLHRDLLERVRPWHCGLVQLHDFEKWIELTPICRFHRSDNRHTFYRIRGEGMNLSAHRNKWRSLIEKKIVYRDFFSTIPWDFIAASFHDHLPAGQVSQAQSIEQLTWPLYMAHKDPVVQMIGVEFMLESIRSEPGYARFRSATGGDVWSIYSQTPKIYRAAIAKEMRRLAGDVRTPLGRVRTMLRKTLAGARRRS